MTAVLVILACLNHGCQEYRFSIPNETTCVVFGELMVINWLNANPGKELRSWRCDDEGSL